MSNTGGFTFTYGGQPLTCTVEGENSWDHADSNAGQIIINDRTALVDEDPCWLPGGAPTRTGLAHVDPVRSTRVRSGSSGRIALY